jgi:hypothetical protein
MVSDKKKDLIFRRVCSYAISDNYLRHVCPSVHVAWSNSTRNVMFEHIRKSIEKNLNLIKIYEE